MERGATASSHGSHPGRSICHDRGPYAFGIGSCFDELAALSLFFSFSQSSRPREKALPPVMGLALQFMSPSISLRSFPHQLARSQPLLPPSHPFALPTCLSFDLLVSLSLLSLALRLVRLPLSVPVLLLVLFEPRRRSLPFFLTRLVLAGPLSLLPSSLSFFLCALALSLSFPRA